MKITNHRVEGVKFLASPNHGGVLVPKVIVMHDTAGPSLASARDWFAQREARASAHFIIGRDGEILQMVDLNKQAWHAGASVWKGRQNVNGYGVGIELVNPGKLAKIDANTYKPWYRGTIENHSSPGTLQGEVRHGALEYQGVKWSGYWLDYPEAQMESARKIVSAVREAYGISRSNVITHWMISPGRKIDTNPLFKMDSLFAEAPQANAPAESAPEAPVGKAAKVTRTLNLRAWPSIYKANVLGVLPKGVAVIALKSGVYEKIGDGIVPNGVHVKWTQVRAAGHVGWVMDQYLERIE